MCLVHHAILPQHSKKQRCTSSNELRRTAALFIENPASLLPSLSLSCLLLLFTAYVGTRSGSTLHITPSCCSSCSTALVGYSSAGKNISTGKVQPAALGSGDVCLAVFAVQQRTDCLLCQCKAFTLLCWRYKGAGKTVKSQTAIHIRPAAGLVAGSCSFARVLNWK